MGNYHLIAHLRGLIILLVYMCVTDDQFDPEEQTITLIEMKIFSLKKMHINIHICHRQNGVHFTGVVVALMCLIGIACRAVEQFI